MSALLNPVTTVGFEDPFASRMRRGFLESAFDLATQPTPVPIQGLSLIHI